MSAKFARTLLTALSISALTLAGCGGDDEEKTSMGSSGGTTINQSNFGQVQAALTTSFTNVFTTDLTKGPGTYNGAKSGTVKISGGLPAFTLEFDNYSDDGQLFTDGKVSFSPTGTTSYKYTGDITLSGTYSGNIKIDVTVNNNVVSGTYTVDGQVFNAGA